MENTKAIIEIMTILGCRHIGYCCFEHDDIPYMIDLSAADKNKILSNLLYIFRKDGYQRCRKDIKKMLMGTED